MIMQTSHQLNISVETYTIIFKTLLAAHYLHISKDEEENCFIKLILTHYSIYTPFNAFFTSPPPIFDVSNGEKVPHLDPNTYIYLRNIVKKVTTFSARPPTKRYIRGCPKGNVPHLFGGIEGGGVPLIAKKIWTCERL
jgi:hypothetical protein